jgi:hypothetical protein
VTSSHACNKFSSSERPVERRDISWLCGGLYEDTGIFLLADRRGEPLEGGLSRAVEPPHGKEGAQGKVSVVLGMAGGIRTRRHG